MLEKREQAIVDRQNGKKEGKLFKKGKGGPPSFEKTQMRGKYKGLGCVMGEKERS